MNISEIKVDKELKELLPPLSDDEYEGLEKDIKANGVLDPIILWNGFIADGHNRYEICKKLGIKTVNATYIHKESKAEVMKWIIDHQFARRNLTKSQTMKSLELYRKELVKEGKKKQSAAGGDRKTAFGKFAKSETSKNDSKIKPVNVREEMAKIIGVSPRKYADMKRIMDKGTPEQIERMDKGGKGNSVSAIAQEIKDKKDGMPDGFRKCKICGAIKPVDKFSPGDGNRCRSCMRVVRMESKENHSSFLKDETRDTGYTPKDTANEIKWAFDSFKNTYRDMISKRPYDKGTIVNILEKSMKWINDEVTKL